MSRVPSLEDLGDVSGKRVLVRTDFNVPMEGPDDARIITDDFRIRAALPTIEYLTSRGAHVVCASHLGRPKGSPNVKYSMAPVRVRLAELAPGVELLENLRFNPGEEGNDPAFVSQLINGIDMYVDDAFGAAHRSHASIVGPSLTLPSAAGRLLQREVDVLGDLREKPKRPFVAVLGGAKVSDKIGVIEALQERVDAFIIGGGMCFTFLAAKYLPIGDSLCERDQIEACRKLMSGDTPIHLPEDIVGLDGRGEFATFGVRLPDGAKGLDIGPGSAAAFADIIMNARSVYWNGPMGMFEDDRFAS
jgi:phosphoglycerate kinase